MVGLNFDLSLFREKLNKIDKQANELKSNIDRSQSAIFDYCKAISNQIDIAVETAIEELNSLKKSYLREIKVYEQECIENMQLIEKRLVSDLNLANDFASKWLNESSIEFETQKTADEHLNRLTKLKDELKGIQLSGRSLKFKKKETKVEQSIGFLELENLKIPMDIAEILKNKKSSLSLSMYKSIQKFLYSW